MRNRIALAAVLATLTAGTGAFAQSEAGLMDIVVSELRSNGISTEGVENLDEQSLAELATLLGASLTAPANNQATGESSVEKKREIENFIASHQ